MKNIESKNNSLVSMNWHLWPYCNYHCIFCFAKFNNIPEPRHLSEKDAIKIIDLLGSEGIKKLTFVGGEPTLCPFLGKLLHQSKRYDITNMVVTNGSGINRSFLDNYAKNIDWIGFSIDSPNEETQFKLGRGEGDYINKIIKKIELVREFGLKIKLNTVVNSINLEENFHSIINKIKPDRWKAFQVLKIDRENDEFYNQLEIIKNEFQEFIERHSDLNPISESNDLMIGSYLMMDPLGRFFQNTGKRHTYSKSILEIGVRKAIDEVGWDYEKFLKRGGYYNW